MSRSTIQHRSPLLIGSALLLAAAALYTAVPGSVQAADPAAAPQLQARPLPVTPAKEVFIRTKPHVNVGAPQGGQSKIKLRPGRPAGPGKLSAQPNVLADWYCGEGSGPGGYAQCTDDLIASCSGTYKPPGTNGPQQTWGMCHESSG